MSSAAVSDDVVYVGGGGLVSAFNATTGGQIWNFSTGNQIVSSPAVYDGAVYIASQDGYFYAIGEPLSGVVLVAVVAVAVIVIVGVLVMVFRKRLKTKPVSPRSVDWDSEET